ncbi:hypothetical protein RRG08_027240 [Elysia crispata]|uniref:Uncharacterized protein n=1 Tax=Elysia crispata TaxID=231223 RepID=A0AAE1DMM6_9GAST|nr:hypothetical protein RRG08_027240 [Elysia crispata]
MALDIQVPGATREDLIICVSSLRLIKMSTTHGKAFHGLLFFNLSKTQTSNQEGIQYRDSTRVTESVWGSQDVPN